MTGPDAPALFTIKNVIFYFSLFFFVSAVSVVRLRKIILNNVSFFKSNIQKCIFFLFLFFTVRNLISQDKPKYDHVVTYETPTTRSLMKDDTDSKLATALKPVF